MRSFQDLLRKDVRLVQANPDAAAIGKVTRDVLQSAELWEQLDAATAGYRTTVNDVANDVLIGAADAGLEARAELLARGFGRGVTLPTFRLLRS
ncbi:MAG: solute-binding protein [Deltaproteobacteria bacterium]|nr:solute-binding protein [Deltaproteobacteria bacterium]